MISYHCLSYSLCHCEPEGRIARACPQAFPASNHCLLCRTEIAEPVPSEARNLNHVQAPGLPRRPFGSPRNRRYAPPRKKDFFCCFAGVKILVARFARNDTGVAVSIGGFKSNFSTC